MSQALYRKWRPARFNEVIGQEHVTRTLKNSVAADRVGHAYLLCGPRGTGKTTTARLIAKAVNCLHEDLAERPCNVCAPCVAVNEGRFLDLIEIDAASNTGVDDIRDLRDKINFSPSEGRFKVYIIDEVHMLSPAAFNALLKTLEEPPPHAMFVLATTEEHKVPLTIRSRCQQFNFRLLTEAEISTRLKWLTEQESLQIEPAALALVARQGAGSLRDAESLLDQLVAAPGDTITLERAQLVLGTATDEAIHDLTEAWLKGDGAAGLAIIQAALSSGADARQFCRQMVSYLRDLLLLSAAGSEIVLDGPVDRNAKMLKQAQHAPRSALIDALKHFSQAAQTPSTSWQPQLPLELAFIELLPVVPTSAVIRQVVEERPKERPKREDIKVPAKGEVGPGALVSGELAESKSGEVGQEPQATDAPDGGEASQPTGSALRVAEPEPTSKPKTTAQDVALADFQTHWREMLSQVGQHNKNLPPLLHMAKPLAVEGHTLVLGFDFPIFKEKFDNTEDAVQLIGDAFRDLMSDNVGVRSVVSSEYQVQVTEEEFRAVAEELGGVVRND